MSSAEAKYIKSQKWPPTFSKKVDMRKVNIEIMKQWITGKVSDLLKADDDVLIELIFGMLESETFPDPKKLQWSLTGFLEQDTAAFCSELWELMIDAQSQPQGVPKRLIEAKKEEMRKEKEETERLAKQQREARRQEEEKERNSSSSSSSTTSTTSTSTSPPPPPPPSSRPQKTYYTLFPNTLPHGTPPSAPFTIPLRALRSEFLTLQQRTHPDLFPPPQRKSAELASAQLNTAYTTLRDPLLRAGYLLTLRGHQDPSHDETARLDDPALMMEVLEAQEELESATGEDVVADIMHRAQARVNTSLETLESLFARDDVVGVREEVMRLRYWRGVVDAAHRWEAGAQVVLEH
ncbi:hypothetical protein DRE_06025 [Drechslerella stenobrocha 248]|uniref:PWI domain-containing protein n=1 Tax=Drechslerella stenobrocha 248 TaxID=1043628 RepID=W7HYB4_9PEZI|nr:hypothetical protein DRE_06025 [Drechslerella stenobrocha 248]